MISPMALNTNKLIVGLGELLWDMLPAGPQLGGTISNFAVMAGRLGDRAVPASRVGEDDLGRQARARLTQLPVDLSFLQVDPEYPTGSVSVVLHEAQPEYVIHSPAAWDFLELTPQWQDLAQRADAVCFGSLAQRSPVSGKTIQGFLAATTPECVRIFDVNLRTPFYSKEVVKQSLEWTTILKMNDAELPLVLDLLGLPREASDLPFEAQLIRGSRLLLGSFPLDLVCITLGKNGSLLVNRKESDRHPGLPTRMGDAIGAGDAFAAALTRFYLQKAPLAVMSEAGNRWGSWVASQSGAMPPLDSATRESISAAILARSTA
jgi:fructokinase